MLGKRRGKLTKTQLKILKTLPASTEKPATGSEWGRRHDEMWGTKLPFVRYTGASLRLRRRGLIELQSRSGRYGEPAENVLRRTARGDQVFSRLASQPAQPA